MAIYPVYEDIASSHLIQKGDFPFYISIHPIKQFPSHHHEFVELSFVLQGQGVEWINGQRHLLRPGSLTLLLPHHIHRLEADEDTVLYSFCCMFDWRILSESGVDSEVGRLLWKSGETLPLYADLEPGVISQVEKLMEDMHIEYQGKQYGKASMIRAKLMEILVLLIRHHKQIQIDKSIEASPVQENQTMEDILHFLHLHFAEPITLDLKRTAAFHVYFMQ